MKRVHVAVGVILDAEQNVLLTRRPEHVHQGGLWEFPGGKVESGESLATALQRELLEELDITPLKTTPLLEIQHDYKISRCCWMCMWCGSSVASPGHWRGSPWPGCRWVS